MPLIDLKSDLAWYGKRPPGFRPNQDKENTDYSYNKDLTSTTTVQGFSNTGEAVSFKRITSANAFNISGQGTATMLTQLGSGTKFPIGPEGQAHEFDIARTGFHPNARYEDVYNKLVNSGLANTYTLNSPIDDMYNKFKVRDEAWNPTYIKHPLVLRGIQRDGSSKPQRFGLVNVPSLNIPRGGVVTAAERTLLDSFRIGKFLASPQGILFLAKQQTLTLQNPNVNGEFRVKDKVYNPAGLLSIAPSVHSRISFSRRYEDVKRVEALPGAENNRLTILKDRIVDKGTSTFGALLIGQQELIRREFTPGLSPEDGALWFQNINQATEAAGTLHRWRYKAPYQSTYLGSDIENRTVEQIDDAEKSLKAKGTDPNAFEQNKVNAIRDVDTYEANPNVGSLDFVEVYNADKKYFDESQGEFNPIHDEKSLRVPGDTLSNSPLQDAPAADVTAYQAMTYGDIRRVAKDRTENPAAVFDFRTNSGWDGDTLVTKYGFVNYDGTAKADPVNNNAIGDPVKDDLITVSFTPLRTSTTLAAAKGTVQFRAYITSLSDSFSPSWNENNDQGRADAKVLLSGWGREISLGLMVAVHSESELKTVWGKLDELAKMTYPIYAGSGFAGTYVKVTIGKLYKDVPMYITSLGYDWDNETPWDIDEGVPLYTNVDISMGWIGTQRPDYNTKVYSYNNNGSTKA